MKPFNVRVSLVEPGSINTKLTSNRYEAAERLRMFLPEFLFERVLARIFTIDASR